MQYSAFRQMPKIKTRQKSKTSFYLIKHIFPSYKVSNCFKEHCQRFPVSREVQENLRILISIIRIFSKFRLYLALSQPENDVGQILTIQATYFICFNNSVQRKEKGHHKDLAETNKLQSNTMEKVKSHYTPMVREIKSLS